MSIRKGGENLRKYAEIGVEDLNQIVSSMFKDRPNLGSVSTQSKLDEKGLFVQ